MQRLHLKFHGGGELEVHGSLSGRQVLVILGRENFRRDDPLVARLIAGFTAQNRTVARYQSEAVCTMRQINPGWIDAWPRPVRRALKALLLLLHPTRWRHYSARYRAETVSIAYQAQSLRELVRWLGPEREIVLLARSASARVATRVADEVGVSKLVCLGYPFRHPDHGDEPDRYAHLVHLRTPMLIVQGKTDSYGGIETAGRYQFAPGTCIEWVETGHDFDLDETEWERVRPLIDTFIGR